MQNIENITVENLPTFAPVETLISEAFQQEDKICLKNEMSRFNASIQKEVNGDIQIKCEEIYIKKNFIFVSSGKEIGILTKNHSLQMSSSEFYNMFIDNMKNNTYILEYNDKESLLKIIIQIKFVSNSKESIRKFEIKFICLPFNDIERLNKIVFELQSKIYSQSETYINKAISVENKKKKKSKDEITLSFYGAVVPLKNEIAALKTEIAPLKTEISLLKTKIFAWESEIDTLKTEISALKVKVP